MKVAWKGMNSSCILTTNDFDAAAKRRKSSVVVAEARFLSSEIDQVVSSLIINFKTTRYCGRHDKVPVGLPCPVVEDGIRPIDAGGGSMFDELFELILMGV